ncbi:MAG: hypothetical protein KBT06_02245 [Prevotellaceae bacterium]|nr:hypothetical protein [Candidatus Colivivens equi]
MMIRVDKSHFIEYNSFIELVKGIFLMKRDLSERQYIQLARESFIQTMKEVPFISDIKLQTKGLPLEFNGFRATVCFTDSEYPQEFFVDVKSNGEKRFAFEFIEKTKSYINNACCLFIAPYISETTAEMFRNNKTSFMDLSGNCYILTRRIIFHISGKHNQYIQVREKKNYLSKSSSATSAILRTMLEQPEKLWKVKELSDATGKAIGTVSNVKAFLTEKGWINDQIHSFGLKDINELLHEWSKDYNKKESLERQYYSLDSIPELERQISDWSLSHNNSALLSGFSAAARYAPVVRYNKVHVYVDEKYLHEFVNNLNLEQVQTGGNIVITIPHDNTPCMFSKTIDGSIVSSPVQTVLDLLSMPNRGEEAANAIIGKIFDR